MEIVGKLCGISSDDDFTYLRIGDKVLSFPRQSIQAEIIEKQLSGELIGRKIALLSTDDPVTPLLVRIFEK